MRDNLRSSENEENFPLNQRQKDIEQKTTITALFYNRVILL
jgi:hypothetical protein